MAGNRLPTSASTVIVIRPDPSGHCEVFLTRRPPGMEFLGGFYVFPGGAVNKDDGAADTLSRCHGLSPTTAQHILQEELSPELSLAHWVAGARELFEEVGILFSVSESGKPLDMKNQELKNRLAKKRRALVRGEMSFSELLESERLYCDLARLAYFSHRVTPERYPIRFDARFFLARMPADQTPLFQSEEVWETLWITPRRALEEARKGRLPLMPPTQAALGTLIEIGSWHSLSTKYQIS